MITKQLNIATVLAALLCFSLTSYAEESINDSWMETGLSKSDVQMFINEDLCLKSKHRFVACLSALNALSYAITGDHLIAPSKEDVANTQLIKDFGHLKIVKITKIKKYPSDTASQIKIHREELEKEKKKWTTAYNEILISRHEIKNIFEWVLTKENPEVTEAFRSAILINKYLEVFNDPHTQIQLTKMYRFRVPSKNSSIKSEGSKPTNNIIKDNVTGRIETHKAGSSLYVKIKSFTDGSCGNVYNKYYDLYEDLKENKENPLKGVILDLRGNGGGRVREAQCIVDIFLPKNKVVYRLRDSTSNRLLETFKTTTEQETRAPAIVLIDALSASASEIVSGALQDHERALVLGVRSFGKGTIQNVRTLSEVSDGIIFSETIGRFHLPSGRTNQISGITPDIEVYREPNPSEDQKYFFREDNIYLNPIASTGPRYRANNHEYMSAVDSCATDGGSAVEKYSNNNDIDYQLQYSLDVMDCITN